MIMAVLVILAIHAIDQQGRKKSSHNLIGASSF